MKAFQQIKIDFKKGAHVPALDGLRGFALLIVMSYHFFALPYAAWFSLDSFFVLSGFLITGILIDTKQSKSYFKNYIARRMLRILPLYYGVLIIFFVIVPLLVNTEKLAPFSVYYQNQGYFWSYLQNWILLLKEHELKGSSRLLLHLWSLGVEEQYYIVWPFLVLFLSTKNLKRVIIGLIVFSVALKCYYFFAHYTWQYNYFSTLTRLDALSIGGLIAIGVRNKNTIIKLEKIAPFTFKILFFVLLGAIVILRPRMPNSEFLEPIGTTLFAVFFASLILYCMSPHKNNYVRRWLEMKIFIFFGRFSYSMYIFHVPMLALVRPLIITYLHNHFSYSLSFILSNIICFGLTLLVSQFTWYLIEKPALSLKRFFKYDKKKTEVVEKRSALVHQ